MNIKRSGFHPAAQRDIGDFVEIGLRRTRADLAVVRAAQWASTDRQAATIVARIASHITTSPAAKGRPVEWWGLG